MLGEAPAPALNTASKLGSSHVNVTGVPPVVAEYANKAVPVVIVPAVVVNPVVKPVPPVQQVSVKIP